MYIHTYVILQEDQTLVAAFQGLAFSVLGSFGFAFLISSFVIFPVQEKESKVIAFTCIYMYNVHKYTYICTVCACYYVILVYVHMY